MPTVVTLSTDVWNLPPSVGRITFYDPRDGYFYVFYPRYSDKYLVYRSSPDGINWSDEVVVSHEPLAGALGFHVFFDGTYVYVAYATGTYNTGSSTSSTLWLRRGTPSGGAITWEDPIQIRRAGGWWFISMCKTASYYYLAFKAYRTIAVSYCIHVYKSPDGTTWTEIRAESLGTYNTPGIEITPHPIYSDGILLVYAKYESANLRYWEYDGSSWVASGTFGSKNSNSYLTRFSLVTAGGKAHIVYPPSNAGGELRWQYFDGSWSSINVIDSRTCNWPSLSAASDALHAFYTVGSDVLHRKMDYGTLSWSDYEVIASGEDSPGCINAQPYPSGNLPLAWRTGTTRPYSLRFTYITIAVTITKTLSETVKVSDALQLALAALLTLSETLRASDKVSTAYGLAKLRYVKDHVDVFEEEDHNLHVTLWRGQVETCREWASYIPEISDLVSQLELIVNQMRYVKYRDKYYSEDHNRFVEAWRKLLEIDRIVAPGAAEVEELADVVNEMTEIAAGVFYYADLHNLFAEAWEIQEVLNSKMVIREVIILNVDDWDTMLEYVMDGAVIIANETLDTATPEDVKDLLSRYRVKILVTVDTAPYHEGYCGAWRDILYAVDHYTGYSTVSYDIRFDHDKQHFGLTTIPENIDYLVLDRDHIAEVTRWTYDASAYYAYRYYGKGVVAEVPYDGMWKDVSILDKYLRWKPCRYPEVWHPTRVIVISETGTSAPGWHEYPNLVDTLKAWADKYGYVFKDLRTT